MRGLIAIVGRRFPPGSVKGWRHEEAVAVPSAYVQALRRAGAEAAILHPASLEGPLGADRLLTRFDGLLLIGGPDIDPDLYADEQHPACYGLDRVRDEFEIALVRSAVEREVPVLAICRGIQLVNVALGGTLDQHIAGREGLIAHGDPDGGEGVTHPVELEPGSLVAKSMGVDRGDGLSHHHQAIDRLGEGLRPVGWTADGLVEAVEVEDRWVLGVQWHPEQTAAEDSAQQGLFEALVSRAAEPRAG